MTEHVEGDTWEWCKVSTEMVEQLRGGVEVERARLSIIEDNVIVVELTPVAESREVTA